MSNANDGMTYSRPGGMTAHEREKIRRRLGGGAQPSIAPAPGSNQLAGSQPSSPVVGSGEADIAEHNRKLAQGRRLERHRNAGIQVASSLADAQTLAQAARMAENDANRDLLA